MPAKPAWILNVPNIIEQLRLLRTPVVDRIICERLFGVRRRRAIELMQHFGGFRSGNTILLDREALISWLQQLAHGSEYENERCRKRHLAEQFDELHRCRVQRCISLPVSAGVEQRTMDDLPSGITLQPGQLIVTFSAAEELFAKLYELAKAALNNFDGIASAVSTLQPGLNTGEDSHVEPWLIVDGTQKPIQ